MNVNVWIIAVTYLVILKNYLNIRSRNGRPLAQQLRCCLGQFTPMGALELSLSSTSSPAPGGGGDDSSTRSLPPFWETWIKLFQTFGV